MSVEHDRVVDACRSRLEINDARMKEINRRSREQDEEILRLIRLLGLKANVMPPPVGENPSDEALQAGPSGSHMAVPTSTTIVEKVMHVDSKAGNAENNGGNLIYPV